EGWDFAGVCRVVRAAGYDGLELAPFTLGSPAVDLSVGQRVAIRRTAEDAGLAIAGLHWLLARTDGLHLTSRDPVIRRRTSDYLAALAELSHDLGGSVMVFGSPAQRSTSPEVDREAAYEFAAETLRGAAPAFERFGQSLCVEPLARDETNFLNS